MIYELSSFAVLFIPLSRKLHEFSTRKYTLHAMCFGFCNHFFYKTYLNPRRILRDIVINLHIFYVMYMLILLLFTDIKVF